MSVHRVVAVYDNLLAKIATNTTKGHPPGCCFVSICYVHTYDMLRSRWWVGVFTWLLHV
jgi:hypothetical protein